MISSPVVTLRLIARRGDSNVPRLMMPDERQVGDVIEITDRPIYRVDPRTRKATTELRRFRVGHHGSLELA